MNEPFSLILIPARGGSKGIPRKNLLNVGGKPLLAWSIETALQCSSPNFVVVSSNDDEIGGVAISLGAKFIKRPEHLASDVSSTEEAMLHSLENLLTHNAFSHIVLLQATCPIRRPFMIDMAFKQLLNDESDSLVGVVRESPFLWSGPTADGKPKYDVANRPMRQSFAEADFNYRETGNIYITSVQAFMNTNVRVSGKTSLFILDENEALDIDTLDDADRASSILRTPK